MAASARWREDRPARPLRVDEIAQLWADIEAEVASPVIVVFDASGAALHAVIGEPMETVLLYFPPDYEQTGTGSLHSVGDPAGADREECESPLTAYYLGHHTEFPRWSAVSHEAGRRVLAEFLDRPHEPPGSIVWEED